MDLVVQVGAGTPATAAHLGDNVAPFDLLPAFFQSLAEMGIPGDHTIAMADGYHLSISTVAIDF